LDRDFFAYIDDAAVTRVLATTDANAALQAGAPGPVAPLSHAPMPRGWKARRIFGAYLDAGKVYRTSVPILDPSDPLWSGGSTTFTKGGQTFVIEGKRGEQRFSKGG
jgi:hypothetical protein